MMTTLAVRNNKPTRSQENNMNTCNKVKLKIKKFSSKAPSYIWWKRTSIHTPNPSSCNQLKPNPLAAITSKC